MSTPKAFAVAFALSLAACGGEEGAISSGGQAEASAHSLRANPDAACWGQATQVFARMGEMGEHASAQETPRLGLRNLARALFEEGAIPDDSLQALGAFVADALGLSIEACM